MDIDLQASESDDLRSQIEAAYSTDVPEPAGQVSGEGTDLHVPAERSNDDVSSGTVGEVQQADTKGDHPTDPTRYVDGTFKPTKAEAAPVTAAPVDPKVSPSTDDQTKASAPAPTPVAAPPAGWTAAEKAEWSKLPPAIQAAVSRREAEMTNGGQQWSEQKRRYEAVLEPVAIASRSRGLSVEQGVQALIAAQNALDRDPVDGIKRIAATYGVDLATLAGTAAEGSREQPQPDISALVRQAMMPVLAPIQERIYREDQQRQQSTVDLVTTFATSPGHEHFDSVQDELMAMIPAIRAANPTWPHEKVLQDAYDRAVYANPTTRTAVLAAQRQAEETQRQTEAKARADKARRAGTSVTGSPTGTAVPQAKDSLRAEIEAAYAGG